MLKKSVIYFVLLAIFSGYGSFFIPHAQALSEITKINTSSDDGIFPQTVTDSSGYLHAVWMELTAGQEIWMGANPGIFYSRWNGDTWSTPLKISENTEFAQSPGIAVDSNNTVHVVWADDTYEPGQIGSRIAYKTRSSAGTWSGIETLPVPAGTLVTWISSVAVDTSNTPHVSFSANTDGSKDSVYWTRKVAGNWTTPELVSKTVAGGDITNGAQWSQIKADATGKVHLIYSPWGQGVYHRTFSAGVWGTPFQLNTFGDIGLARLAITPVGEIFVTYSRSTNNQTYVRWTQSGGTWQSELNLSSNSISYWALPIMGITTDSKERAHVGWGERNEQTGLIDLKYRSFASGVWGPTNTFATGVDQGDAPFVYPDLWDNQHFMWVEKNAVSSRWEVMYRVAEGTISTVGTGGGTVTANPQGVTQATLSIPNGALASSESISIHIGPVPESVDPQQITLPRAFTFRPEGLTFLSPATATIFYTNAEVEGIDERDLRPWFWDSTANAGAGDWVAQTGASVNTAQNRITASLNHFSLYGISSRIVKTTFQISSPKRHISSDVSLVQFSLSYADNSPLLPITNSEDLQVAIKSSAGDTVKSYSYLLPKTQATEKKNSTDKEIKDAQKNEQIYSVAGVDQFQVLLDFKKSRIPNGTYSLEVQLAGNKVGEQQIIVSR